MDAFMYMKIYTLLSQSFLYFTRKKFWNPQIYLFIFTFISVPRYVHFCLIDDKEA